MNLKFIINVIIVLLVFVGLAVLFMGNVNLALLLFSIPAGSSAGYALADLISNIGDRKWKKNIY